MFHVLLSLFLIHINEVLFAPLKKTTILIKMLFSLITLILIKLTLIYTNRELRIPLKINSKCLSG